MYFWPRGQVIALVRQRRREAAKGEGALCFRHFDLYRLRSVRM